MNDRNNTNFEFDLNREIDVTKILHAVANRDSDTGGLNFLQAVVLEYARVLWVEKRIKNAPKGLIVNHEMGTGKTITSISIAQLLQSKLKMRCIVIGPKSLADNFAVNVRKYEEMEKQSSFHYKYFTARANNLAEQIRSERFGRDTPQTRGAMLVDAFENTVLIFDEWHLLANSIAHGRERAVEIYEAAQHAKNCYKIILTGTFIINSPFEAVPALNLCIGSAYFPEDRDIFNNYCGTVELQNRNRAYIQNATQGILSYVAIDKHDENYPRVGRTRVIELPMESDQLSAYVDARLEEKKEGLNAAKYGRRNGLKVSRSFEAESTLGSSYRMRSRIASNGMNKINWIMKLIEANSDEIIIIQSNFVDRGGCRDIAAALEGRLNYQPLIISKKGIIENGPDEIRAPSFVFDRGDDKRWNEIGAAPVIQQRYYFMLTGENNTPEQIKRFVEIQTDYRNRFGAYCHVLITSSVGVTGLDLKYVRHAVYMSPFYQVEDFNQFKARGVRFGSSNQLDPIDRNVQPYILVSSRPPQAEDSGSPEDSTDEYLLALAMMKMRENANFISILRSVSLECMLHIKQHKAPKCRTCVPLNRPLTYKNLETDVRIPSGCMEPEQTSSMIEIHGIVYSIFSLRDEEGKIMFYLVAPDKVLTIRYGDEIYSKLTVYMLDK